MSEIRNFYGVQAFSKKLKFGNKQGLKNTFNEFSLVDLVPWCQSREGSKWENEKQTGKIFILNAASVRNRGFIRKENGLLQSEVQISEITNM